MYDKSQGGSGSLLPALLASAGAAFASFESRAGYSAYALAVNNCAAASVAINNFNGLLVALKFKLLI